MLGIDGPMRILRNGIQRSVALRYFITLLHYQICSYVTDAILDVPVLKQRLLEIDREIIEYLLGMSNNAFTLSELEVWLVEISHVRLWRNWQTRWI